MAKYTQQLKIVIVILALGIASCNPKLLNTQDPHFKDACDCNGKKENRIGAICHDETLSKSTGSGACSHHGGVKIWLCKQQ